MKAALPDNHGKSHDPQPVLDTKNKRPGRATVRPGREVRVPGEGAPLSIELEVFCVGGPTPRTSCHPPSKDLAEQHPELFVGYFEVVIREAMNIEAMNIDAMNLGPWTLRLCALGTLRRLGLCLCGL